MSDQTKDDGPKKPLAKEPEGVVIKADGSYALTTFADMSARMHSFGRFVLREVFQCDSGAARGSARGTNPMWLEPKRRAGGRRSA